MLCSCVSGNPQQDQWHSYAFRARWLSGIAGVFRCNALCLNTNSNSLRSVHVGVRDEGVGASEIPQH